MGAVQSYLLAVVSVSMIAAIASTMVKASLISKVLRLACGILVLLVVISPFSRFDLTEISYELQSYFSADTSKITDASRNAEVLFQHQVQKSTQVHIEQIASKMGISVTAKVTVQEGQVPIPTEVELIGQCRLDQREALSDYIAKNIGIPYDKQSWRTYG